MMAKNEGVDIYVIPENFIEGGRILNGMFKTRNFVEAVALALAVGIPLWFIPYPSVAMKMSVLISVVLPVFIMGVIGINDSSLLEFLQQFLKWRKNKRIMIYNTNTRSRDVRPVEVVLSQELPKDKIVKTIDTWRENKRHKSTGETFIEGRDFVFDEEVNTSYTAAENKLLSQDDTDETAEKKPKKERKHKGKKAKDGENTETAEETVSTSDTEEVDNTEAETAQEADTEPTETENEPHEVSDRAEENSAQEGKRPAKNDVQKQEDEFDKFIDVEAVTDETDDVFDIITGE